MMSNKCDLIGFITIENDSSASILNIVITPRGQHCQIKACVRHEPGCTFLRQRYSADTLVHVRGRIECDQIEASNRFIVEQITPIY